MDAWTFDSIELDRMWRGTHPCLHGGVDNACMGMEWGRGVLLLWLVVHAA